jgi:Rieske Fe-S protein
MAALTSPPPSGEEQAMARTPLDTPITRRQSLRVLAAGAVVASGGLSVLVGGCGPAPTPRWVSVDADPATFPVGEPYDLRFTATTTEGTFDLAAWVVRQEDDSLVVFSPTCTHQPCTYIWLDDERLFECTCHAGQFNLEGEVLSGPPPRPLDRVPVRAGPDGLELEVALRGEPLPT